MLASRFVLPRRPGSAQGHLQPYSVPRAARHPPTDGASSNAGTSNLRRRAIDCMLLSAAASVAAGAGPRRSLAAVIDELVGKGEENPEPVAEAGGAGRRDRDAAEGNNLPGEELAGDRRPDDEVDSDSMSSSSSSSSDSDSSSSSSSEDEEEGEERRPAARRKRTGAAGSGGTQQGRQDEVDGGLQAQLEELDMGYLSPAERTIEIDCDEEGWEDLARVA